MSYLNTALLTHRQQVTRLYKSALRELRNFYHIPFEWRYHATILRARFDENKDIKDLIEAKKVVQAAEAELEKNRHWLPIKFPYSPGGTSYGREPPNPDSVMDRWHPLEKAQFPDYFARRAELKKEYIDWYVKKYGTDKFNPEVEGHIHFEPHDDHHDEHAKNSGNDKSKAH